VNRRLDETVSVYDAVADDYHLRWRAHRPLDAARKFAALARRGAVVLDPACGPALDIRLLRDAGLKVVAGDLSHEAMKVGKLMFPKGSLARWDLRRLPFLDEVFGGVWAPAALQHLARAELVPALAELRRVQRAGPIFLTFREGSGDLVAAEDPPAGSVYITSLQTDELKTLLAGAGYREIEVEPRPDPLGRREVTWLYGWGRV
jgi:ubiquinone/menaquinone biosynthesis C-methylase UbiE